MKKFSERPAAVEGILPVPKASPWGEAPPKAVMRGTAKELLPCLTPHPSLRDTISQGGRLSFPRSLPLTRGSLTLALGSVRDDVKKRPPCKNPRIEERGTQSCAPQPKYSAMLSGRRAVRPVRRPRAHSSPSSMAASSASSKSSYWAQNSANTSSSSSSSSICTSCSFSSSPSMR